MQQNRCRTQFEDADETLPRRRSGRQGIRGLRDRRGHAGILVMNRLGRIGLRAALGAATAASLAFGPTAFAHNNPQFTETLLQTVSVKVPATGAELASSEPFQLEFPPRTIEMIWKVEGEKADAVSFSVEADGKTVA